MIYLYLFVIGLQLWQGSLKYVKPFWGGNLLNVAKTKVMSVVSVHVSAIPPGRGDGNYNE